MAGLVLGGVTLLIDSARGLFIASVGPTTVFAWETAFDQVELFAPPALAFVALGILAVRIAPRVASTRDAAFSALLAGLSACVGTWAVRAVSRPEVGALLSDAVIASVTGAILMIVWPTLVATIVLTVAKARGRIVGQTGLICPGCAYDRRGIDPTAACPECAAAPPTSRAAEPARVLPVGRAVAVLAVASIAAVAVRWHARFGTLVDSVQRSAAVLLTDSEVVSWAAGVDRSTTGELIRGQTLHLNWGSGRAWVQVFIADHRDADPSIMVHVLSAETPSLLYQVGLTPRQAGQFRTLGLAPLDTVIRGVVADFSAASPQVGVLPLPEVSDATPYYGPP